MVTKMLPPFRRLATAALCVAAGSASAALTAHPSQASFLAAVSAPATDSFNEQALGGPNFPHIGSTGSYGYTADAQFDGIYFVGSVADVWLSTTSPAEHVVFYDFTTPVYGIAGQFFGTDFDGNPLPGLSVSLQAFDGVNTLSHTLTNANASSFLGFVSDRPLVHLLVLAAQPELGDAFTTVNNLTLALAAVPEPATYAMWLAGLAACGITKRRRS